MADTPSAVLLLRLQSTGSNTNLWGGYLNTALQTLEQASKGYQSLAVSGDATVSWSNYATGNAGQTARLKLTGSPAASFALTFPAFHNFLSVENGTMQAGTIKCSGGTGISIAAGQRALLYCDGVDYYNAAPTLFPAADITINGKVIGMTAGTANGHGVNKLQMDTAIALATISATPGTLRITASDTTPKFLSSAITVSDSDDATVTATVVNSGANETLNLDVAVDGRATALALAMALGA